MKTAFRNCVSDVFHAVGVSGLMRRIRRRSLVVLMYHRILPVEDRERYPFPDLVVTPEVFRTHVEFCARRYHCLPLSEAITELRSGKAPKRPLLSFTFDDGYRDNFDVANPILESRNIRATFFVVSAFVGRNDSPWYDRLGRSCSYLLSQDRRGQGLLDETLSERFGQQWGTDSIVKSHDVGTIVNEVKALSPDDREKLIQRTSEAAASCGFVEGNSDRIMSRDQLRSLANDGHEIGSHTKTHPILTQLSPDEIEGELRESRDFLSETIDSDVRSIAYPNGDFNEIVVTKCRQVGYHLAATTLSGLNEPQRDPFRLRRLFVAEDRLCRGSGKPSQNTFELELTGMADSLFIRRARNTNRK